MTALGASGAAPGDAPPYARVVADLDAAERAEGWLARCAGAACYVALTRELVDALAAELRSAQRAAGGAPVLEVCAGDGSLAAALGRRGVRVVATDVAPPPDASTVECLSAAEALRRHQPRVVLGSFVPVDAGVDAAVLDHPGVDTYVVLNAWLGGEFGSPSLWARPAWRGERLEAPSAWMVSRHDAWLGDHAPRRRRGEAWRFVRAGA